MRMAKVSHMYMTLWLYVQVHMLFQENQKLEASWNTAKLDTDGG